MSNKAQAAEFKGKGNAALSAGDFDEAVAQYTKAIDLDPTDHVFFSNRSAAYLSKGDAEAALKDSEQCVALKPDWSKGYGRKGAALHALGRLDAAIEAYEEGLKVEPDSAALNSGLEEVTRAMLSSRRSNPGGGAFAGGNPFGPDMIPRLSANPKFRAYLQDPAFMRTLQVLNTNPQALGSAMQDPRMIEVIGYLLGAPEIAQPKAASDGDVPMTPAPASPPKPTSAPHPPPEPAAPETDEEKLLRAKKETAAQLKSDATVHYRKREFAEALRLYAEAAEANPDPSDISFQLNQAAVQFETGDYTACIQICENAVQVGREHRAPFAMLAKAFARIGNAQAKLGNFDAAIAGYEASLMESHTDDVYDKLKKIKAAKKKADEEAYLDPVKAEEAKQRGNELFKEGKFREAIEEYSEAIKRKPDDAVYYCNRATARTKLMDFNGALDDCNTSIKLNPAYIKAYSRKGALEALRKEYHKAMETYKKGLELDPENDECKEGLVKTMQQINATRSDTGDSDRAERAMADPEIQGILRDPMVQSALQDLQRDATYAQKVMNDPQMAAKIQKLMAAGVLKFK